VAQDSAAAPSPTTGTGLIAVPRWPFVINIALFGTSGAAFSAYHWATPQNNVPLAWFFVDLLVVSVMAGIYLVQLARAGWLRLALAVLPFWGVGVVRRAAEFVAGGWAGGWVLGVLGAVAGALAGVVAGTLFARWFVSTAGAGNRCSSGMCQSESNSGAPT
jgi:hypothetical protein